MLSVRSIRSADYGCFAGTGNNSITLTSCLRKSQHEYLGGMTDDDRANLLMTAAKISITSVFGIVDFAR